MKGFKTGGRVPPKQNQEVYINTKAIIGLEAVYKDGMFWGSIIGEPKPHKPEDVFSWIDKEEQIQQWENLSKRKRGISLVKRVHPSILNEGYQLQVKAAKAWRKQKTRNMGGGDDCSLNYWMNDMDKP